MRNNLTLLYPKTIGIFNVGGAHCGAMQTTSKIVFYMMQPTKPTLVVLVAPGDCTAHIKNPPTKNYHKIYELNVTLYQNY
jgi:hypothetical protein